MNITAERRYEQLRIYFDGNLHVYIKLLDLVSIQSWIHGEKEYLIEYNFKDGVKMTSAYGEKEKWLKVLSLLNNHVTTIG